jgi:catalase (peroxidase I)
MATMTLPLHELELAERKGVALLAELDRHPANAEDLNHDLHEIMESTNHVLRGLDDPKIQLVSDSQLLDMATKLESVVALRSKMVSRLRSLPLSIAESEFAILENQSERLDSLAETFRMGADPAARAHMLKLIQETDREAKARTKANRRDLVGSLHD